MPNLHTPGEDRAFCAGMIVTGGVTVAEADGSVLGFLGRSASEVAALFVDPPLRGRGIGSALLKDAQQRCTSLSLWTFQANTDAQKFYIRHGFAEARRTNGQGNQEGLPDIEFIWSAPS